MNSPDSDFDTYVSLSVSCRDEIEWWIDNVEQKNGKAIRPKPIDIVCRTDASLEGFGYYVVSTNLCGNGRWTPAESANSINYLELLAVFYTLITVFHCEKGSHISFQSDNTTAVSYINDMGGMASLEMDTLAKKIWDWCLSKDILISATHIAGSENCTADFNPEIFRTQQSGC